MKTILFKNFLLKIVSTLFQLNYTQLFPLYKLSYKYTCLSICRRISIISKYYLNYKNIISVFCIQILLIHRSFANFCKILKLLNYVTIFKSIIFLNSWRRSSFLWNNDDVVIIETDFIDSDALHGMRDMSKTFPLPLYLFFY